MVCEIDALCFAAADPAGLAGFWAGVLGWDPVPSTAEGAELVPRDDTGFRIRFFLLAEPKTGPNRIHLDLTSSSLADQQRTVERALGLGGHHLDIGQGDDALHVVLADPEDNEFCVIEPGNGFLADCGFLGALSCDGSEQVGRFWSAALGWPLVWDQDGETAIRSPHGGPKIAWGGPPVAPLTHPVRVRLDLVPASGSDVRSELDRLVGLGAAVVGSPAAGPVVLTDPDGNEVRLLARG